MMRKLRDYLICFFFALLLIYLQKFLAGSFYLKPFSLSVGSLISALINGFLFGLISCPVCGLPLGFSLASTEKSILSLLFKNFVFQAGRFIIILSYAYTGGLIIQGLNRFFYNLSLLLGGILLILIGSGMLLKVKLRLPFIFLRKGGVSSLFYLLFGLSLGFACSLEATGFLVPLWLGAGSFFTKLMSSLLFSFFAVLPTLIISILIYSGFKGIIFLFKGKANFFLVNTSGFFLLLFGIIFVVSFFR